MRISNFILNYSQLNKKEKALKEGNIIRGKIVDVDNDLVKLDLGNGNYVLAKTQIPLEEMKHQTLNFLIKMIDDTSIIITPIYEDGYKQNKMEPFVENLLREYDLDINEKNTSIVENLLKHNMAVDKNTVEKIIRLVGKIEFLLENIAEKNIDNFLKGSNLPEDKNFMVEKSNIEEFIKIIVNNKKLYDDINVIRTSSLNNEESLVSNADKIVSDDIKLRSDGLTKLIKNIVPNGKIDSQLISKIVFLMKSNINVSINNLSLISQLVTEKKFLEEDFHELINIMKKDKNLMKQFEKELITLSSKIEIELDTINNTKELKDYYSEIANFVAKVKRNLASDKGLPEVLSEKIDVLDEKLNFLNKLNTNNVFIYFPMTTKDNEIEGEIFILNKHKKRKNNSRVTVFISLDTKNLHKIELLCDIFNDSISLNFKLENKTIIQYIDSNKDRLRSILNKCGFKDINFTFEEKKETINILDLVTNKNYPNYFLDVRV